MVTAGSHLLYNWYCLRHGIILPQGNTMRRSFSVFVLAAVFEVIFGQDEPSGPYSANDPRQGPLAHPYQERIPRNCWAPPSGISPYECCPIPKLYPEEIMESCGIEKPPADDPPPPNGPPNFQCKGKCLMKHSELLNEDESINYEKLRKYLQAWGHAHADFTEAILKATDECAVEKGPPGPPKVCDHDKLFFCLTSTILWNCKIKEDIPNCQILKEHMDECRPFYMKPKDETLIQ